jgi:hypothetical protein
MITDITRVKYLNFYQQIRKLREAVKDSFILRMVIKICLPKKCLLGG